MKYVRKPTEPQFVDAIQLVEELTGVAKAGDWFCTDGNGKQFFMSDEEFSEKYEEHVEKEVTAKKPQETIKRNPDLKFMPDGYNPRQGLMDDSVYGKI